MGLSNEPTTPPNPAPEPGRSRNKEHECIGQMHNRGRVRVKRVWFLHHARAAQRPMAPQPQQA